MLGIAAFDFPKEEYALTASARLVALRKEGKSKPRPVAMGLAFRRLGARWLMRTGLPPELVDYLHRGQQFGTAAKGINEKLGHALQAGELNELGKNGHWDILLRGYPLARTTTFEQKG